MGVHAPLNVGLHLLIFKTGNIQGQHKDILLEASVGKPRCSSVTVAANGLYRHSTLLCKPSANS